MKPFHFSLQAVKTLRQRQEQISLEAFARAVRARQEAIDNQHARERELHACWTQLEQRQVSGGQVQAINQLRAHCHVLQQELTQAQQVVAASQQAANEAWEQLNESRQQLELVNKFYQRRRSEYERELRQEEQKYMDEIAGRQWQAHTVSVSTGPALN